MTYVAKAQSQTITLTANISDTMYTALSGTGGAGTEDDHVNKIFIEIKNNGVTTMVNPIPATVTFPSTAVGSRSIRIDSVPLTDDVEGIFSVTIRYSNLIDADTNGPVVDIAKAIFSRITTSTEVACF